MLNPEKKMMAMYMPLLAKMAKDNPSIMFAKVNFKFFCDVNLLIFLCCLLPMLEIIHALIKFAQKRDLLVCDYVVAIKTCQGQLYFHYVDLATKYVFDIFKDFQGLIACNHSNVNLKWKTNSLNFNTPSSEYLTFDSSNYTFWATCVNAIGEKVQVT
jgi:hypothetical protein